MVPRTACWAALIFACLNLVTEIFNADQAAAAAAGPAPTHAAEEDSPLPPGIVVRRAAEFFGWLAALVALASLIGFIPAIAVFVFLYMGIGFREPITRAAIFAVCIGIFCWGVFDRGLSVPWPQSLLGDYVPRLRESTGLL
jgi:hypothetical protein